MGISTRTIQSRSAVSQAFKNQPPVELRIRSGLFISQLHNDLHGVATSSLTRLLFYPPTH
jgi:hypothetical protein